MLPIPNKEVGYAAPSPRPAKEGISMGNLWPKATPEVRMTKLENSAGTAKHSLEFFDRYLEQGDQMDRAE